MVVPLSLVFYGLFCEVVLVSIFDVVHVVPLTTSLKHTFGLMVPAERLRFEVCEFFVKKLVVVLVSIQALVC